MMDRRHFILLSAAVLLGFLTGNTGLQAQTQEQIDQFNKERRAFFNENLELTDAEARAFWPLYEDFSNRKMKLAEDERNAYQYGYKNADHLSDQEIRETLAKIQSLKEEQLALEKDFNQKFMKAIPATKVMKLGKVEWDFRRHLMRKLRDQGQGDARRESRRNDGNSGSSSMGPGPVSLYLPPVHF